MADMFAGVISKLMQALKIMLTKDYKDDEIKKTLHNKLTIEPIADNEEEYFYNQKGAKIFKDIER